jgi:predicted RND superfamily exporter protein
MALIACICPLLATSSALGFLFWLGMRFGTILCVSPFLVMAIGVDDAFLMIHR